MTREEIAQAMLATPLERNPAQPPEAWNRGVRNVTTGVLGGLAEIPQKAIGAAQHYTDTGQYNPEPVMGAAASLMTGGMPMAAKGAAGMFGGRLSMGADLPKLMKAEDMALAKAPAKQIWDETGWVQRPDRQWRYEMSDKGAEFNPIYLARLRDADRDKLGSVFQHPGGLYEAYPHLKDVQFGHSAQLPQGAMGYYLPERMDPGILRQAAGLPPKYRPAELVIGAQQPMQTKVDTALHEIQHAIQSKEGFAKGGSPPATVKLGEPSFDIYKELRKAFEPEKLQKITPEKFTKMLHIEGPPPTQQVMDTFTGHMADPKKRSRAAEFYAKQLAYSRLLGESEARLATARGSMSAEERRKVFPALDVPERKQIIRMHD